MQAAGTAWSQLAAEIRAAATSYSTVILGLTNGSWLGPASASMADAAAPYAAWMNATAVKLSRPLPRHRPPSPLTSRRSR